MGEAKRIYTYLLLLGLIESIGLFFVPQKFDMVKKMYTRGSIFLVGGRNIWVTNVDIV